MWIIVAIIVAIALVAFLAYVASKPNSFQIARSLWINAPAEKIFPYFNDTALNQHWSPYESRDPNMKRSFSTPSAGVGAVYEFAGNGKVGSGRIEIVESTPPTKVVMKLDMLTPIKANNIVTYTLAADGNAASATWAMHGNMPFLGKLMHTLFDFDKMIGRDFENGLAKLKTIVESPTTAP